MLILLFLFVVFMLIITLICVFRTKEETNSTKCKIKNSLIKISTILNIILSITLVISTIFDINNLNIQNSNNIFYKIDAKNTFITCLVILNVIGTIILSFKMNLKNIFECCNDNSIKLFSKIYSNFCLFLFAIVIITFISSILYVINFSNIDIYLAIHSVSNKFEYLLFALMLLTILNVCYYNQVCSLKYNPHNTIKKISEDDFKKIKQFNFGTFSLGWIWGLFNESYRLLAIQFFVSLIPFIGIFVIILLQILWGVNAHKMVLTHKQCKSVEAFFQSKKEFNIIGLIYLTINIMLIVFAIIF